MSRTPGRKPKPVALYHKLRAAMIGPCAVPRGARVLVACSGGPDSLALLAGLAELRRALGIELIVAHLDHGLRGRESAADARAVERRARLLDLPVVSERLEGRRALTRRGLRGEAGLRVLRREFLARAARENGAGFVALGHTADDQAETLLLRLARGSGVTGLAAMRPRRGRWLRPLLAVTREEIGQFLRSRGLRARVDRSNLDRRLARNRVRHDVLPPLRRINPAAVEALAAAAERLGHVARLLDRTARKLLQRATKSRHDTGVRLVREMLLGYHPLIREHVIRQAWADVGSSSRGLTRRHLAAVVTLLERGVGGRQVHLPSDRVAHLERGLLYLGAGAARPLDAAPPATKERP